VSCFTCWQEQWLLSQLKHSRFQDDDLALPEHGQVRKVCAKLNSGVRFGVGLTLERSCGPECASCDGTPFHRSCRFYDFRPHYQVRLEKKATKPLAQVHLLSAISQNAALT
jgi:hypothetical protein